MFEVGQEVVCLRKGWGENDPTRPEKVYTVSKVWVPPEHGLLSLGFLGVPSEGPGWIGHDPSRFRPVTCTRDTLSIESFLTIKPGQFEDPRRVVEPCVPVREGV